MITETDKLEAEIICCISQAYQAVPNYPVKKETLLDYLEKCFLAKKIVERIIDKQKFPN